MEEREGQQWVHWLWLAVLALAARVPQWLVDNKVLIETDSPMDDSMSDYHHSIHTEPPVHPLIAPVSYEPHPHSSLEPKVLLSGLHAQHYSFFLDCCSHSAVVAGCRSAVGGIGRARGSGPPHRQRPPVRAGPPSPAIHSLGYMREAINQCLMVYQTLLLLGPLVLVYQTDLLQGVEGVFEAV